MATDIGFTAPGFATWRAISSVLALAVLLVIGIRLGRTTTVPWSGTTRLERVQLAAMGVFVVGTTLGLFSAFEHTTIALTLIVFYSYPAFVAVIATRRYGEPLGPMRVGAIVLASAGMALIVITPALGADGLGLSPLGVGFALVAALSQTGYALVASRGFVAVPAIQAGTYVRAFALIYYVVVLVPLLLLAGEGPGLVDPLASAEAWVLVVFTGLFGAAIPTALLLSGYRRVGPTRGAVLMLFEPVVGVLLAALLFAERPAPLQFVGGVLVITGATLVQLGPSGERRRADAIGVHRSAGEG